MPTPRKAKIEKQVAYVISELDRVHSTNIGISTGPLSPKLIKALADAGIEAKDQGFFGYWMFTRKEKVSQ